MAGPGDPGPRRGLQLRRLCPPGPTHRPLLLAIPNLVAWHPGHGGRRRVPVGATPALSYVLSLLALKLTATRRVSHVYDIAADPGAALFAALTALPKATALTTYSYRLEHRRQAAFLAALDKAALTAGLADGEALNLDFRAVIPLGRGPGAGTPLHPRPAPSAPARCTLLAEDTGHPHPALCQR